MRVNLMNNKTGVAKQCKVGFSWTFFFFGFWVSLFRGDWAWLLISLIVDILGLWTLGTITIVYDIIMAFIYNKIYIKKLIEKNYLPSSKNDKNILMTKGYSNKEIKISNID